jgi:hypothetical protein
VEQAFQTDRRDLFIEHVGKVVNRSKDEQILIPGVMELYRERIERDPKGLFKLYPFPETFQRLTGSCFVRRRPAFPQLLLKMPAFHYC